MHLLEMEITNKCNLNCKHCYNRGETKEDMPLDEVKKLLAFANKHKVGKVIISGGEACMSSHAKEIFTYIAKQRKSLQNIQKIVLQSNGSIERFLDTYDFSGIDLVHLSFDIDENGIRKIDKNHTIALAKKIEEKGIGAYLFTTVHKQNIDYIDEIVQCANQAGISIAFNVCLDTGKDGEVLLSKEQKVLAYEKLLQYEKEGKIRPVKHPHIAVIRGQKEASSKIRGGCTAGIASCSVLSNGDVIPCPFLRIRVGNIREKSLEEIWRNVVEM